MEAMFTSMGFPWDFRESYCNFHGSGNVTFILYQTYLHGGREYRFLRGNAVLRFHGRTKRVASMEGVVSTSWMEVPNSMKADLFFHGNGAYLSIK